MSKLTHFKDGRPHMVDVSDKAVTARTATAEATLTLPRAALEALEDGGVGKGDPLVVIDGVRIVATARTADRTGVEMEALTAVSVAALTVYDMLKAASKGIEITRVRLLSKTGGKSGDYLAPNS
jgi:cyclic pyranopterin monophosphate synthase